jgi:hypothetical protein
MRIARRILIFTAIVALIALTMSPAADLAPFDVFYPVWFVLAAIPVVLRKHLRDDPRPFAAPFAASHALRAPPLQ